MNNAVIRRLFMKLLGIETSCDETAVAVVESGRKIRSSVIRSQMKSHRRFGGVVPELASRLHTETLHIILDQVLAESSLGLDDLEGIAVTYGPGLEGSLLVGMTMAKTLAYFLDVPLIPTHHLHGHIYAPFLNDVPPEFPFLVVLVSGGHTMLIHAIDHGQFTILGQTRDDAAGEAFDKVSRLLNLGYPGGPCIEKEARKGNSSAFDFPRAMKYDGLDFSFSGLKTAVKQTVEGLESPICVPDVCASFQQSVIDILSYKAIKAAENLGLTRILLTGGVSANTPLRDAFSQLCSSRDWTFYCPEFDLSTDNAAMIAAAGYYTYHYFMNKTDTLGVTVQPSASLEVMKS